MKFMDELILKGSARESTFAVVKTGKCWEGQNKPSKIKVVFVLKADFQLQELVWQI